MTHRPSPTPSPPYSLRDLAMHNWSFNCHLQGDGESHIKAIRQNSKMYFRLVLLGNSGARVVKWQLVGLTFRSLFQKINKSIKWELNISCPICSHSLYSTMYFCIDCFFLLHKNIYSDHNSGWNNTHLEHIQYYKKSVSWFLPISRASVYLSIFHRKWGSTGEVAAGGDRYQSTKTQTEIQ